MRKKTLHFIYFFKRRFFLFKGPYKDPTGACFSLSSTQPTSFCWVLPFFYLKATLSLSFNKIRRTKQGGWGDGTLNLEIKTQKHKQLNSGSFVHTKDSTQVFVNSKWGYDSMAILASKDSKVRKIFHTPFQVQDCFQVVGFGNFHPELPSGSLIKYINQKWKKKTTLTTLEFFSLF